MVLLNGTPGNTDGTEITSEITLKNILNGYAITNYANSGTTYNTNRNFIGFEIDKEYYDAGCNRIDKSLGLFK